MASIFFFWFGVSPIGAPSSTDRERRVISRATKVSSGTARLRSLATGALADDAPALACEARAVDDVGARS